MLMRRATPVMPPHALAPRSRSRRRSGRAACGFPPQSSTGSLLRSRPGILMRVVTRFPSPSTATPRRRGSDDPGVRQFARFLVVGVGTPSSASSPTACCSRSGRRTRSRRRSRSRSAQSRRGRAWAHAASSADRAPRDTPRLDILRRTSAEATLDGGGVAHRHVGRTSSPAWRICSIRNQLAPCSRSRGGS